MKRMVLEQRLGIVATVCPDGTPNLSPKGTTTVWDDEHLMFGDIRSPQTIANLRASSAIEINVVDPLARRGFRFKGTAEVFERGGEYDCGIALLVEREYATHRVRAIVRVRVATAAPLLSPAYDDGATEDELRAFYLVRLTGTAA